MKQLIIACSIYLLLAWLFTWPSVTNPNEYFYGSFPSDKAMTFYLWNTGAYCLDKNCETDPFQGQPMGVKHYNLRYMVITHLPTAFLIRMSNTHFIVNLVDWFSLVFAAISAFVLAKYITKDSYASFYAGLAFGFSSWMLSRIAIHPNMASAAGLLPLSLLFLLKFKDNPTLKTAAVAAFIIGITGWVEKSIGYITLASTGIFFLFFINDLKKHWKLVAIIAMSIFILLFPQYIVFRESAYPGETRGIDEVIFGSATLDNYLVPSVLNPFLGPTASKYYVDSRNGLLESEAASIVFEKTLFLNIPLLLAIYALPGILKQKKDELFFYTASAIMILISIGPYVPNTEIPSIAYLTYQIVPVFRAYSRFGMFAILSVSILAAYAIKKARLSKAQYAMLILGTLILATIFPTAQARTIDTPIIYKYLKQQTSGLVAEYPFEKYDSIIHYRYLYYQTIHKQPLMNGIRDEGSRELRESVLDISKQETVDTLRYYNVTYVLVHNNLTVCDCLEDLGGLGTDRLYRIN